MTSIYDQSFTYPIDFPNYKKIAIIMQKYNIGESPTGARRNLSDTEETLSFESGIISNSTNFNQRGTRFCKVKVSKSGITTRHYISGYISDDVKQKFGEFIHPITMHRSQDIEFIGRCSSNDLGELVNQDAFITNVKFVEEHQTDIIPLMCSVSRMNSEDTSDILEVNLNQFARVKHYHDLMMNPQMAKNESVDYVIDVLLSLKDKIIRTVRSGLISITRTNFHTVKMDQELKKKQGIPPYPTKKNSFPLTVVKFAGFTVFKDHSLEKYKYQFHPGIHLISYILEQTDQLTRFKLAVQKEAFKKV